MNECEQPKAMMLTIRSKLQIAPGGVEAKGRRDSGRIIHMGDDATVNG